MRVMRHLRRRAGTETAAAITSFSGENVDTILSELFGGVLGSESKDFVDENLFSRLSSR